MILEPDVNTSFTQLAIINLKKQKKKENVPVTGKHALLFLVVFVPLLYTVYVLFMLFRVYIGLKVSVIKKKKVLLKDILSCLWFIMYKCLFRPCCVCHVYADEMVENVSFCL